MTDRLEEIKQRWGLNRGDVCAVCYEAWPCKTIERLGEQGDGHWRLRDDEQTQDIQYLLAEVERLTGYRTAVANEIAHAEMNEFMITRGQGVWDPVPAVPIEHLKACWHD